MSKVRVYQLAKEVGLDSKALLQLLREEGDFCRSASSTLDPSVVRRVRDRFDGAPKPPTATDDGGHNPGPGAIAAFVVVPAFNLTAPDEPYDATHQLARVDGLWFELDATSHADASYRCRALSTQHGRNVDEQTWPAAIRPLARGDLLAVRGHGMDFIWLDNETTRRHRGRPPLVLAIDDPRIAATPRTARGPDLRSVRPGVATYLVEPVQTDQAAGQPRT